MSKSIKTLGLVSLMILAAACARQEEEEFVIVEPEPISVEPTHTGKYR